MGSCSLKIQEATDASELASMRLEVASLRLNMTTWTSKKLQAEADAATAKAEAARAREEEWTHRASAMEVCETNKKCHKRYNGMAVEASGKAGEKSAEAETFAIEAREAEWKAE